MSSEKAPGSMRREALGSLGRFRLVRHLATGGMAEIYLASASGVEGFSSTVVLKRILPTYATNRQFIRMFLDEARIAATLQHPNIAQVFEIGEEEGSYYFTMEFVPGTDMRQVLRAGHRAHRPLPLSHALAVVVDATCGLHYAHEKVGFDGRPLGIVHRDVSPSNVIVSFDGAVKLVDFGIAKAALRDTQTRVGQLKGKVAYMSPEQARGEELDRRSDVFSAGILLYELTTRRKLFRAPNELATLNLVQRCEPPPPSTHVPDYPPELERIVMRALQASPFGRYQTAQDLQLDLEEFVERNGLVVSSGALGQYMRELFGLTAPEWREALEAGVPLPGLAGMLLPAERSSSASGSLDDSADEDHEAGEPAPRPPAPAMVEVDLDDLEELDEADLQAAARSPAPPVPPEAAQPAPLPPAAAAGTGLPARAPEPEPDLTVLEVRPDLRAPALAAPASDLTVHDGGAWYDNERTVQSLPPDFAWLHPGAGQPAPPAPASPRGDPEPSVEVNVDAVEAPISWSAPDEWRLAAGAPPAPLPAAHGTITVPPPVVSGWRSWRPLLIGVAIGMVLAAALVLWLTRVLSSPPPPAAPPTIERPTKPVQHP